ncbi:MAG: TerB family tellurite resistance protein [Chloroflexota bacterium]
MSERNLILALAKVIIAAAWADNELTDEEQNLLKDLLYKLPETHKSGNRRLNSIEWARLEMFIESPISADERHHLIEELQTQLRTDDDKKLALEYLDNLVHADGVITSEEKAVVTEIQQAMDQVNLNIFGQFSRLLQGPFQRRQQAISQAPNRERYFDEFIRNKVYYGIQRRLEGEAFSLNLPDEQLRRLAAIGGLMARIAHIDQQVTDSEFNAMTTHLEQDLSVSSDEALFIAQVAISEVSAEMDFLRLTRELATTITSDEGEELLDLLFTIADADGYVTAQEAEEIYNISYKLNLTHRQFIAAKTKIPADRRAS